MYSDVHFPPSIAVLYSDALALKNLNFHHHTDSNYELVAILLDEYAGGYCYHVTQK
jgi:hypothetical protein